MESSGRSSVSRQRAELALATLVHSVGDRWTELVLIGGLLPPSLVDEVEPHQGTTDVDIVLDLALIFDRDEANYEWLEQALHRGGFVQATPNNGWRWLIDIDGYPVLIDFLVDVPDSSGQEIALPGAIALGAMNVSGAALIFESTENMQIGGSTVRAAGLGGFLAAKASAIVGRGLAKDLYDFAYVIVHASRNGLDVAQAVADAVASRSEAQLNVLAATGLFRDTTSRGTIVYAAQAFETNPVELSNVHALDAVAAVRSLRIRLQEIFQPEAN